MNGWFDDWERMHERLDRMFDEFFIGRPHKRMLPGKKGKELMCRMPVTDVYETESRVIARIELPGVEKKDIELNITENDIEIKVEKKHEVEDKDEDYYRYESRSANFYRRIPLPAHVKAEDADAKFDNGVLKIEIPKEKAKEKKKKLDIK